MLMVTSGVVDGVDGVDGVVESEPQAAAASAMAITDSASKRLISSSGAACLAMVAARCKRVVRRAAELLDADDPIADARKPIEDRGIVAGNHEPRIAGHAAHAILRAQVEDGVERLRDRLVRVEVLVEIHVVGRDHDGRLRRLDADVCDDQVCLPPVMKLSPEIVVSSSPRSNDTFPATFRLTISCTSSGSIPPCVLGDCHASPV